MSGYLVLVILKKEPGRSQNKAFTSGSGEGTNPLNETNQGEKKEICYCFLCVVLFKQRRPKLHRSWPLGLLNRIHFYNERIDVSSSSVKGHITESTCPPVDDIHNCAGGHTSVKTSLEHHTAFFKKNHNSKIFVAVSCFIQIPLRRL